MKNLFPLFALMTFSPMLLAQIELSAPQTTGLPGAPLDFAINVSNLDNRGIVSFSFNLHYDPAILRLDGVQSAQTMTAEYSVFGNPSEGRLRVVAAGEQALRGSGLLVRLTGQALRAGTSSLRIEAVVFNDGIAAVSTREGFLRIGDAVEDGPFRLVVGDAASLPGQAFTLCVGLDHPGGYELYSFSGDLYFDPAVVALSSVDLAITSSAWLIESRLVAPGHLRFAAAGPEPILADSELLQCQGLALQTGETPVVVEALELNEGALFGETLPGRVIVSEDGDGMRRLGLPPLNVGPDAIFEMPLQLDNNGGQPIYSLEFVLHYEPNHWQFRRIKWESGALWSWQNAVTEPAPGLVRVAAAGVEPLGADGVLLQVEGRVIGQAHSDVRLQQVELNEGQTLALVRHGRLTSLPNRAPRIEVVSPSGPSMIRVGETVSFEAVVADPDNHFPIQVVWSFGGGLPDHRGQAPFTQTFSQVGHYDVSIQVRDGLGLTTQQAVATIVVVAEPSAPTAFMEPSRDLRIHEGQVVFFEAQELALADQYPIEFRWEFDGLVADHDGPRPGWVGFDQPGDYQIALSLQDRYGMSPAEPLLRRVRVLPCPFARLPATLSQGLQPIRLVAETACLSEVDSWHWEKIGREQVPFGHNQNPVTLDETLTTTTVFQLVLFRENREVHRLTTRVLVAADAQFRDWNGDGLSTVADWRGAIAAWGDAAADGDGDGRFSILDLLYVNGPRVL